MSAVATLGTRRVYEGRILDLRIDTVQYGDAPSVEREIVEHPGSVVVVPLTDSGTVLLVRQWRQSTGESLLEAPAGTIEPPDGCVQDGAPLNGAPLNGAPEAAAQRELREETGHRAASLSLLGSFWVAPGWCTEYMHAYVATGLFADPLPQDVDEDVTVDERPLSEIPDLIRSGEIRDAKSIAALLMTLHLYDALPTARSA